MPYLYIVQFLPFDYKIILKPERFLIIKINSFNWLIVWSSSTSPWKKIVYGADHPLEDQGDGTPRCGKEGYEI